MIYDFISIEIIIFGKQSHVLSSLIANGGAEQNLSNFGSSLLEIRILDKFLFQRLDR